MHTNLGLTSRVKKKVFVFFLFCVAIIGLFFALRMLIGVRAGDEILIPVVFDTLRDYQCFPGLKAVPDAHGTGGKNCAYPMCSCYVCVRCGNGICGKGENACNCPEDCPVGQGHGKSKIPPLQPQMYKSKDLNDVLMSR